MKREVFLIETATIFILIFGRVRFSYGEILSFGINVTGASLTEESLIYSRIYLLPYFAQNDGFVFAYSTVVQSWNPALLIIYRPQSNCSMVNLKAVGHVWYYPSMTTGSRESVYLESYYKDGCIPIKRFDMIGLYFPSKAPSITYTFRPPVTTYDKTKKCFDDGIRLSNADVNQAAILGDVTFQNDVMPYTFQIEVFYYTSAQNTSVCEKGNSIPSNRTVLVRPSTPTPNYKGIPGVKGVPGIKGPIGNTGDHGDTGKSGEQNNIGEQGGTGFTGSTGERGQDGLQGDPGITGSKGQTGVKGLKGIDGKQGDTGPQGDPGFPGHNFTVILPKKDSVIHNEPSESLKYDPYFSTDRAIWALFIWLALLTFLVLLTFIILVTSGTWLNKL